nr:reverse transcriptase domain-containing protein [Tanacetum cinerariifolium]
MFLEKYFPPSMVTKLRNEITNFRQCPDESLFEAWEHYKLSIDRRPNYNMLPVTQIDTFYNGLTLRHRDTINVVAAQRSESSSSITSSSDPEIAALKAEMAKINKKLMRVLQPPLAKPRTYMLREPIKRASHGQNPPPAYQAPAYQAPGYQAPVHQPQIPQPQFIKINTASSSGLGTLPSNTFTNPKEDLKGITTRSGTAYQGPTIPTTTSSLPLVVERETEVTKDTVHPTNNESTKDVQPSVVQTETPIPNSEPVVAPIIEPVVAPIIEPAATPVSAAKPNLKPLIPYPSRLHDQKLCDKANDQKEKFFQIFKDLNFNISFADALILMPKFGPIIKTLLTNKDKLSELPRTPLNEHCLTVLLKKLPEKMWNKLSLPDLYSTCMTLELADRSISHPVGVAEDVYIKVGTIHFPADFVVVDFDADPRVPLILERSFLKTKRALIDVFKGELTLRVGKEAIT